MTPPYVCQRCSHYQATVHMTIMSGGMPFEYHICVTCQQAEAKKGEKRCPRCSSTLSEIERRGRFGCPLDYEIFQSDVVGVLERYHGASKHVGKNPAKKVFSS